MDSVILGHSGLRISAAGLGCGGHSRLGQEQGKSVEESIRIVREAIDLGINYIDTAREYGTEEIVGRALEGRRDEVVLSTKHHVQRDGLRVDAATMRGLIEESLRLLRSETIDVLHLHGLTLDDYDYAVSEILPELDRLRDAGVLRFFAVSEPFARDFTHQVLQRVVQDNYWDIIMVGFNILNPSARHCLFPTTIMKDIGVEVMYAVRNIFSRPQELIAAVAQLLELGLLDPALIDARDPLGFLLHDGGAASIVEAAYRFVRHEPGCHVVLTGTGSLEHLRHNVTSINLPPLPKPDSERLATLFGNLAALSGN